jgi:hypothetical protein
MPFVTTVITSRSGNVPVNTIKALHTELAAVGLPVGGADASATPRFGSDTETRVRDFQSRYHLSADGTVTPTTGGVLVLAALAATQGDRSRLRTELKNAVHNVPNSPEYNYWLARYAVMAGDYDLAAHASPHLTDLSGLGIHLADGVFTRGDSPPPRAPEVPFPENFYSYRHASMALSHASAESARFIF